MARHIDSLTGVRGVAAIWVALLHSSDYLPTTEVLPGAIVRVIEHGWLGVDLFFVLSGFVISYVHQRDFLTFSGPTLSRFLKLRLARIYPAHLVALLMLVPVVAGASLLSLYVFTDEVAALYSPSRFVLSLALLNGWGFPDSVGWNIPSWSVSSEWFAYLCFPFIAYLFNRVHSPLIHLGIILGVFGVTISLALLLMDGRQYMLGEQWTLLRVFSEFLIGCSVYNLYRVLPKGKRYDWAAFGALGAIVGLSAAGPIGVFEFGFVVAFAVLVLSLSRAQGMAASLFSGSLLLYLGRISYSLYLTHYTVLMVLNQLLRPVLAEQVSPHLHYFGFMLVYLATAILVAHLMYALVEEPGRRLLRRVWVDRIPAVSAGAV